MAHPSRRPLALLFASSVALAMLQCQEPDERVDSSNDRGLFNDGIVTRDGQSPEPPLPLDSGSRSPTIENPLVCAELGAANTKASCPATLDAGARPPSTSAFCARSFGDRADDAVSGMFVDGSGGLTITGTISGQVDLGDELAPSNGVFVAKYDPACKRVWSKRFEQGDRVVVDRSGGAVVFHGAMGMTWLNGQGEVIAETTAALGASDLVAVGSFRGGIAATARAIYDAGRSWRRLLVTSVRLPLGPRREAPLGEPPRRSARRAGRRRRRECLGGGARR